jgi:ElaB/YqjD/DUF883 family membrane-anchored ribosome-binding protein
VSSNPDPLPDHDRLWAGVHRGMEAELVTRARVGDGASGGLGNDGNGEEGKVADEAADKGVLWSGEVDGDFMRVLADGAVPGGPIVVFRAYDGNPADDYGPSQPPAWDALDSPGDAPQLWALAAHLACLLQAATQGQQGDLSNEGAQAIRDRTKAAVRRLRAKPGGATDTYKAGWKAACDAVLRYLGGQAERYAKPGGLTGRGAAKGKGKGRA